MHIYNKYNFCSIRLVRFIAPAILGHLMLSGCALPTRLQTQTIGDLGRFEFGLPQQRMQGAMIGAPHGASERIAAEYAQWISERTGAGLAIGYGFKAKRIPVTQPLVTTGLNLNTSADPARRGSVYHEFNEILQRATNGNLEFYAGIRFADTNAHDGIIEVAVNGFTFEEVELLKDRFARLRDRALRDVAAPKIAVAMDSVDKLTWSVSVIKHHGVLMRAEKGLNLRLARGLTTEPARAVYRDVLAQWIRSAYDLARRDPSSVPQTQVWRAEHGRIESIPSRKNIQGIVIGAPHGSFDEHTAELVNRIAYRTGLAAVIAKGFTPTESGGGWRINVNRPTERRYPGGDIEIATQRSKTVFEKFKDLVVEAARGSLDLYIDIHQNAGQPNIEVATVGISKRQAEIIKQTFREIRDRRLREHRRITRVDLAIEPLDQIEIGAWAAKSQGILSVARRSLHFELPAGRILWNAHTRALYSRVFVELVGGLPALLRSTDDPA